MICIIYVNCITHRCLLIMLGMHICRMQPQNSKCLKSFIPLYVFINLFVCFHRPLCMFSSTSLYVFIELFVCFHRPLCMFLSTSLYVFIDLLYNNTAYTTMSPLNPFLLLFFSHIDIQHRVLKLASFSQTRSRKFLFIIIDGDKNIFYLVWDFLTT